MSIVGDNIRALRTLYGSGRDITQAELAEIAGVTRETVNKWESGTIGNVRTSNINRLREHFGLSVDDLRSESSGLAAKLRKARDGFGSAQEIASSQGGDVVPLVALADTTTAQRYIEVPADIARQHPQAFAFEMPDESMARVLPKGSHVVVDPGIDPRSGSLAVVLIDGGDDQPVVRRLHRGSTKTMLSVEGFVASDDTVCDASEIHVLGTIVWCQSSSLLC